MDEKLVESIDKIVAWLEQGGELVSEQAPLVVQELIQYTLISTGIVICVLVAVPFVAAYLVQRTFGDPENPNDFEVLGAKRIVFLVSSVFCWLIALGVFIDNFLFVLLAPKVFVLERLAKIVGN